MKVEFLPLTADLMPACRAFNQRLLEHSEPLFVLPEEIRTKRAVAEGGIAWNDYVAVDETGAVRGGVLLMEQRGWFNGREIALLNIQSPLSEGTIDRAYSGVSLKMLQFLTRRNPNAYAVGMGSAESPFARLLKAAGWTVAEVPFQFLVIHAGRFLREIRPLRYGSKKIAARIIAGTGLGAAANGLWRLAHQRSSRGYALEATATWPSEVNGIWERCRAEIGLSMLRDAATLADLYRADDPRVKRYVLRKDSQIVGWSAGLVTPMKDNSNFGDLTVGTILDALAPMEHLDAILALTKDALGDQGAELIVANHTHPLWQQRLKALGFLSRPSNYILATSKALASVNGSVYVTRGDGDGRLNL